MLGGRERAAVGGAIRGLREECLRCLLWEGRLLKEIWADKRVMEDVTTQTARLCSCASTCRRAVVSTGESCM